MTSRDTYEVTSGSDDDFPRAADTSKKGVLLPQRRLSPYVAFRSQVLPYVVKEV